MVLFHPHLKEVKHLFWHQESVPGFVGASSDLEDNPDGDLQTLDLQTLEGLDVHFRVFNGIIS